MIFEDTLTDHARNIYELLRNYRYDNRTAPYISTKFLHYLPELEHTFQGEHYTVFKIQTPKGGVRIISYGSDDTIKVRSEKTMLKHIKSDGVVLC